MNAVTFNEPLVHCLAVSKDVAFREAFESCAGAPLVDWASVGEPLQAAKPEAIDDDFLPRLPFPIMRVHGRLCYKCFDRPFVFRAWLRKQKEASLLVLVRCDSYPWDGYPPDVMKQVKHSLYGADMWAVPQQPLPEAGGSIGIGLVRIDLKNGSRVDYTREPGAEDLFQLLFAGWIYELCADFANPHMFLCKKHPPLPQGKTILWQKAREHYVFVHRTHPANSKTVKPSDKVSDGNTIDRCAHSRRAHFRYLASPKFKKKQGQMVWVKATWVGPEQWSDHSGQIYRIVPKIAVDTQHELN